MPKVKMNIWGRDFKLDVIYDMYEGESITALQKETLKAFIESEEVINDALDKVKQHIIKSELSGGLTSIDNVFKYVKPKAVFIKRDKKKRVAALLCDYKFDIEHGIAVALRNEKVVAIGSEDLII